ncbi:MAG TPA: HAD family hydrolase [Smithellaceae bacterium]|jgi:3-deoxy-D-manno-octulosonate 8-phosphate phosphatase (KDO 8-P phosphatase)|nr:HAD family hydrolase [Smithellaceae bacterium]
MKKSLREKLQHIKILIMDVDGVMTDGRIIINDDGRETKNFDVRDGHGIKLVQRYGIEVALLTGRQSEVVKHRANELGITEVHQKIFNKKEVFVEILQKNNLNANQAAFIGDDIIDIPVLKEAGFSATVADAIDIVKKTVDYVTKKKGGRGAVREVCEMLLQAQGRWPEIAAKYEFAEHL